MVELLARIGPASDGELFYQAIQSGKYGSYHVHRDSDGEAQLIYTVIAFLHLFEAISTPPAHLPDLFAVLNLLLCGGVFGLVWLWSMKRLMEEGWNLIGFSDKQLWTPPLPTPSSEPFFSKATGVQGVPQARQHLTALSEGREMRSRSAGSATSNTSRSRRKREAAE